MKNLIILFIAICWFASCHQKEIKTQPCLTDTVFVHDTIINAQFLEHAPIPNPDKDFIIDSLKTKLTVAGFKLERVRYYLKICQRKPSQTKFLVSWINRAIN
ncbi:MAG: hypothetical protein ABI237_05895 [Ginsengibacter sp.]